MVVNGGGGGLEAHKLLLTQKAQAYIYFEGKLPRNAPSNNELQISIERPYNLMRLH